MPSAPFSTVRAMNSTKVSEALRAQIRDCVRRGISIPSLPDVDALFHACGGDGPLTLLVTLEYIEARQEIGALTTRRGFALTV